MQFMFETNYDSKALTAMAKCIRKTTRKGKSLRSHIIGWIVVVLAAIRSVGAFSDGSIFIGVIALLVAAAIVVTFIFEDRLNGCLSSKNMIKGSEKASAVFDTENPDTFTSETEVGKTEFPYSKIESVAETGRYFVFALNDRYAQVYDKSGLSGGSVDEFREFIAGKLGKPITTVK